MRQADRVLLSYMHMVNCLCHAALQSFLPHICTHNNVPSGQYPDVSILHICSSVQILYITFGFNSSFYNLVYRRSDGSVTGKNPLMGRIPSDNLFPVVTISHTSAHVYSTGGLKVLHCLKSLKHYHSARWRPSFTWRRSASILSALVQPEKA